MAEDDKGIGEEQGARRRSMLLTALYIAQEQHGWLRPQAIERVAQRFGMTPGQVYATASFYTLFKLAPVGRYRIQVCEGLSCYLVGAPNRWSNRSAACSTCAPAKPRPMAGLRWKWWNVWPLAARRPRCASTTSSTSI